MPKRIEMALPVPTKSLLKMSPDAAMLFAPPDISAISPKESKADDYGSTSYAHRC